MREKERVWKYPTKVAPAERWRSDPERRASVQHNCRLPTPTQTGLPASGTRDTSLRRLLRGVAVSSSPCSSAAAKQYRTQLDARSEPRHHMRAAKYRKAARHVKSKPRFAESIKRRRLKERGRLGEREQPKPNTAATTTADERSIVWLQHAKEEVGSASSIEVGYRFRPQFPMRSA